MDFDATLEDSRQFKGALGAVAYVVVRGLKQGGVDAARVDAVLNALRDGLKGLSDTDCDTLVHVLERRLEEVRQGGMLYELVKLSGGMADASAQVIHAALRQNGINARYNHEHLSDAFAGIDNDAEIWVPRGEVSKAMAIMDAAEHASLASVTCGECGEKCPAHFAACWNCSAPLDEETERAVDAKADPADA